MKTLLFLLVLTAMCGIAAGEVVRIPLKSIWAHEMPGTRDVHELEKAALPANQAASLDNQIGDALRFLSTGKSTAKGFAVMGTEKEALSKALAALSDKQQRSQTFSTNAQVFVFFFSHSFGQYVHLEHVIRADKTIEVAYRFVPHETKQLTAHYALIPLGKLPVGKYRVNIVRLPLEQKYVDQGFKTVDSQWNKRVVCQPFSFAIVEGIG